MKNSCILRQHMAPENGKLEHKAFIICINDTFYTMCHSVFKSESMKDFLTFLLFFSLSLFAFLASRLCTKQLLMLECISTASRS